MDHFPNAVGRISRLLFSRPDWDNATVGDRGVRTIRAARGPVKVGSFPRDDTHLMILTLSSGQRLRLTVIPHDTPASEATRRLRAVAAGEPTPESVADWARWDNESPAE